ncbi:hypothetical protein ACFLU4_02090 [Chloroflexota bacterium]
MTPVIRIPDQVFERLQKHAEPLVDTPASVVEKLLDYYESQKSLNDRGDQHNSEVASNPRLSNEQEKTTSTQKGIQPNLFLVPAINTNIRETIQKSVSIEVAKRFLSDAEVNQLCDVLGGKDSFHCWAASRSRLAIFREMQPGDFALLSERGSGLFNWFGKLVAKFHSKEMGEYLWPVVPGYAWEYIYVLDDLKSIAISKKKLVTELGFKPKDPVMGLRRLQPSVVTRILARYNTIEGFLDSMKSENS